MPLPGLSTLTCEIRLIILSHLSQRDLSRCALVNKDWHALCTPELWRVFSISNPVSFHRFKTEKMQQALAKNIHFVQDLETHYIGVIKFIVQQSNSDSQESRVERRRHYFATVNQLPESDSALSWWS
ncbi:hypothetical protein BG006_001893 [Podila minutissima]|uniref:F-box domain-containing protein n=1 Tax=Podila minutissima TaxID=64525 RepID=A0A9P5SXS9_9FUNG|nr:hypothetical protein BG006_001893 [Podila minutissima]